MSIKALERKRRAKNESIRTPITHMDQPLPLSSEFSEFWASVENKINFQQYFISYVLENYKGLIPIYLGGSHDSGWNGCIWVLNGTSCLVQSLSCSYDKADDRIMYHLNHAVKSDHFKIAHILTSDTDIYANLIYHFRDWKLFGLEKIWFHSLGQVSPVH